MRDIAVGVIEWCAGLVGEVGILAIAAALIVAALIWCVVSVAERAMELVERALRVWRAVPLLGRQVVIGASAAWAAVRFVPVLATRTVFLALAAGAVTAWWAWGWSCAQRHRLGPVAPRKAIAHHLRSLAARDRIERGLRSATGSTAHLIERCDLGPAGPTVTVLPPAGMSARQLADAVNSGRADSALTRAGAGSVSLANAAATADGRVVVEVVSEPAAPPVHVDLAATVVLAQEVIW